MEESTQFPKIITLTDITQLAATVGVTVANHDEWIDLDTDAGADIPQLHGTYQKIQAGLDAAYGDIARYAITLGVYAHFSAGNR